ncbi:tripartite tricarboxylate transporter TctB family protein [Kocuria flava]|uniref:tripartite tricarboxylate transporter TctB family protein n=1 Tax=Kocuria flava TaxID=446860 RepID=UPI001FF1E2FD|nr:tripartite tricarboxylate transporter TctB family protein [Kocuria flava]MCJ8503977.1 tripartite tricarboxylate transporter TctB family protein [Kocuria flava]
MPSNRAPRQERETPDGDAAVIQEHPAEPAEGSRAEADSAGARYGDKIATVVIIAVCITVIVQSLQGGIGTLAVPESGFWPLVIAVAVIATTPLIFFTANDSEAFPLRKMARALSIAVAMVFFVVLYEYLGFLIAGALMMLYLLRVVCREPWRATLLVGLIATVVTYVLFGVLLEVNLDPFPG